MEVENKAIRGSWLSRGATSMSSIDPSKPSSPLMPSSMNKLILLNSSSMTLFRDVFTTPRTAPIAPRSFSAACARATLPLIKLTSFHRCSPYKRRVAPIELNPLFHFSFYRLVAFSPEAMYSILSDTNS